jgi:hypothetical protein
MVLPVSLRLQCSDTDFGQVATTAINAGHIKPFIAAFSPLITRPDTGAPTFGRPKGIHVALLDRAECVRRQLRAQPGPWSLAGWSTGALCGEVNAHPTQRLPPPCRLAATSPRLSTAPPAICSTVTLPPGDATHRWALPSQATRWKLLLICGGGQGPAQWQMLGASRGDPRVSFLDFPTGGHNYRNYRRYLPDALQWLDHVHVRQ